MSRIEAGGEVLHEVLQAEAEPDAERPAEDRERIGR